MFLLLGGRDRGRVFRHETELLSLHYHLLAIVNLLIRCVLPSSPFQAPYYEIIAQEQSFVFPACVQEPRVLK